ncbi:MAG: glycoside hydrolase family 28 protein [Bryobacterales bacterium]|nr:glycoside hydrolase family 28 protein [Bryobacterales bacterium]
MPGFPKMVTLLRRSFLCLPAAVLARKAAAWNVTEYGAKGDGSHLDTVALQSAIDACAAAGGGTVVFPAGRYLSGTLVLKSNVTLHLASGAVLVGSPKLADYPEMRSSPRSYVDNYTQRSLLFGDNLENVALEGKGTIDGQGASFPGPYLVRPFLVRILRSRNVQVSGITLRDSPMWVQHYLHCEGVSIHGITVASNVNRNNDGIDIDSCERVRISDCDINSGDDAIVLKSTTPRRTKNVTISNCVLRSHCNALKLGTESNGGFENIAISNCTIYDTRLAGIALETVDGGALEQVTVSGIQMDGVGAPIFVRLGDRGRPHETGAPRPPAGILRNVMLRDIQAMRAGATGCAIAGIPGHPLEHVTLDTVHLEFESPGTPKYPRGGVPEFAEKYPEHGMFGILPAYGFYCRHARDLRLRNVTTAPARGERRPALVVEDVEGLDLTGSQLTKETAQ